VKRVEGGRADRRATRRIATTAATAALALSGGVTAAPVASARSPLPARPRAEQVVKLAGADRVAAELSIEATRRSEMDAHRRRLAGALATELDRGDADSLERAIAAADAAVSDAYARGERPHFKGGIPAVLTDAAGVSEEELADAFESMSRNARQRINPGTADANGRRRPG